ncbi:MAG: hypothetical protein AAF845_20375 [Bacteroidota bacterium]
MEQHPNWILRGGLRHLALWAVSESGVVIPGAHVSTGIVADAGVAESGETRTLSNGRLQEVARSVSIAVPISDLAVVQDLRLWRSLGYLVRAAMIHKGRGLHVLWDEPATVVLRSFVDGRGGMSGVRLILETTNFDAPVAFTEDLLALAVPGAWSGTADVVLPAPGLTVYAYASNQDVTIEARGANGLAIGQGKTGRTVPFTLPPSTFSVRFTGGERPTVLTRPTPFVVDGGLVLP